MSALATPCRTGPSVRTHTAPTTATAAMSTRETLRERGSQPVRVGPLEHRPGRGDRHRRLHHRHLSAGAGVRLLPQDDQTEEETPARTGQTLGTQCGFLAKTVF